MTLSALRLNTFTPVALLSIAFACSSENPPSESDDTPPSSSGGSKSLGGQPASGGSDPDPATGGKAPTSPEPATGGGENLGGMGGMDPGEPDQLVWFEEAECDTESWPESYSPILFGEFAQRPHALAADGETVELGCTDAGARGNGQTPVYLHDDEGQLHLWLASTTAPFDRFELTNLKTGAVRQLKVAAGWEVVRNRATQHPAGQAGTMIMVLKNSETEEERTLWVGFEQGKHFSRELPARYDLSARHAPSGGFVWSHEDASGAHFSFHNKAQSIPLDLPPTAGADASKTLGFAFDSIIVMDEPEAPLKSQPIAAPLDGSSSRELGVASTDGTCSNQLTFTEDGSRIFYRLRESGNTCRLFTATAAGRNSIITHGATETLLVSRPSGAYFALGNKVYLQSGQSVSVSPAPINENGLSLPPIHWIDDDGNLLFNHYSADAVQNGDYYGAVNTPIDSVFRFNAQAQFYRGENLERSAAFYITSTYSNLSEVSYDGQSNHTWRRLRYAGNPVLFSPDGNSAFASERNNAADSTFVVYRRDDAAIDTGLKSASKYTWLDNQRLVVDGYLVDISTETVTDLIETERQAGSVYFASLNQ